MENTHSASPEVQNSVVPIILPRTNVHYVCVESLTRDHHIMLALLVLLASLELLHSNKIAYYCIIPYAHIHLLFTKLCQHNNNQHGEN